MELALQITRVARAATLLRNKYPPTAEPAETPQSGQSETEATRTVPRTRQAGQT